MDASRLQPAQPIALKASPALSPNRCGRGVLAGRRRLARLCCRRRQCRLLRLLCLLARQRLQVLPGQLLLLLKKNGLVVVVQPGRTAGQLRLLCGKRCDACTSVCEQQQRCTARVHASHMFATTWDWLCKCRRAVHSSWGWREAPEKLSEATEVHSWYSASVREALRNGMASDMSNCGSGEGHEEGGETRKGGLGLGFRRQVARGHLLLAARNYSTK